MDFLAYQKLAILTDIMGGKPQPIDSHAFLAQLLGLVGETGEIAEKFKKIYRDKAGVFSPDDEKEMTKELGDVLWYISVLCTYLGISLQDVAETNIEKLQSRLKRGKLDGSGDNR
jgi:NTP pyrophosphatase (non-canonical NTP hydrolase)